MRKSGVQWQKLGKITASRINIRTHFALLVYTVNKYEGRRKKEQN